MAITLIVKVIFHQTACITVPITYHCHCTERLQLETDIERLTSDKADLLTRLQYYEEDLRRATECENLV